VALVLKVAVLSNAGTWTNAETMARNHRAVVKMKNTDDAIIAVLDSPLSSNSSAAEETQPLFCLW
jgi:hypothetical protein